MYYDIQFREGEVDYQSIWDFSISAVVIEVFACDRLFKDKDILQLLGKIVG